MKRSSRYKNHYFSNIFLDSMQVLHVSVLFFFFLFPGKLQENKEAKECEDNLEKHILSYTYLSYKGRWWLLYGRFDKYFIVI